MTNQSIQLREIFALFLSIGIAAVSVPAVAQDSHVIDASVLICSVVSEHSPHWTGTDNFNGQWVTQYDVSTYCDGKRVPVLSPACNDAGDCEAKIGRVLKQITGEGFRLVSCSYSNSRNSGTDDACFLTRLGDQRCR